MSAIITNRFEYRVIDNMVTLINEERDEIVMANPGNPIKIGSIKENKAQVDVVRCFPEATEEDFFKAVDKTPNDQNKGYVLLTYK